MRAIKKFEEFIKQNIVKKQSPDVSRAKFLIQESERSYNILLDLQKKIELTYL